MSGFHAPPPFLMNQIIYRSSDAWQLPSLPAEFSPYNIQRLGDRLYVAYAIIDYGVDEVGKDAPRSRCRPHRRL